MGEDERTSRAFQEGRAGNQGYRQENTSMCGVGRDGVDREGACK